MYCAVLFRSDGGVNQSTENNHAKYQSTNALYLKLPRLNTIACIDSSTLSDLCK